MGRLNFLKIYRMWMGGKATWLSEGWREGELKRFMHSPETGGRDGYMVHKLIGEGWEGGRFLAKCE